MQAGTVQKRLESLPSLSTAGKRVNGLARLLASRTLMEASVNRTRGNRGTATPGIDGETLDGLTIKRINGWVRSMVEGTYRAKPVKRVYIPKANGKLRPLGIPTYADRMVQNSQREILQRIYEPVFSRNSHGFRPGRSCHTALWQVQRCWAGTKWFVEVDIKGFFDNIDHDVLLHLLRRRIDDEVFIATIQAQLRAGVMEQLADATRPESRKGRWQHRPTYSGTPQGGITTPPTIWQKAVLVRVGRIGCGEGGVDAEHDIDVVLVDLDPLDQGADQLALHGPVNVGHPVVDPLGEVLKTSDDQRQRRLQGRLVPYCFDLSVPPCDALPEPCDARLELCALDQALGIAVDQPAHAPAQLGKLRLGRSKVGAIRSPPPCLIEAALILRGNPGRVVQ